jgi:tetratricopeptide (TPR) repeat protein
LIAPDDLAVLVRAALAAGGGTGQADATCIRDALWLAAVIGAQEHGSAADDRQGQARGRAARTDLGAQKPHGGEGNAGARDAVADGSDADAVELFTREHAGSIPARRVDPAGPAALRGKLELARALRPFRRTVPSRHRRVLDVEATVRATAVTQLTLPILRPSAERRFSIDLVFDSSPSMSVWEEAFDELAGVFEHVGVFRDVTRWQLHTDREHDNVWLTDRIGHHRAPNVLRSADRRRVVLLATDAVGKHWYKPSVWSCLMNWASSGPTAVIDPLPLKLWSFSGIGPNRVRVRASSPAAPNVELKYNVPRRWLLARRSAESAVPVPVTELSPQALTEWAATVADAHPGGCVAMLAESKSPRGITAPPPGTVNSQASIRNFFHTASPAALRLAVLAATSDSTTLAVLRAIQEELVPESSVSDLAEVLVSGIYQQIPNRDSETGLRIRMDPSCQAELQNLASRQDGWDVHRAVTTAIARRYPKSAGAFQAAVRDISGDIGVPPEQLPFAEIARSALALARVGRPVGKVLKASGTLPGEHEYIRGLPATAANLVGRQREIDALRQAWAATQVRVLSVVAYGGTGKSALVNAWLDEMRRSHYRGAQKVLAWSFYSQGTRENLVSADLFINSALGWLGDDYSAIMLNPWARGLRLAHLIKQHRFLLVLDGLEPLQYPLRAPHVGGQLTDDSIRALLEELAKPDWEGLCLITTRVPLTDLNRFQSRRESEREGTVVQMDLENLTDRDGADLLQHLIRKKADSRDLQQAVRGVDGHALSVTLLGNYLRDVHGGRLTGQVELDSLTSDVHEGGHARRIMASYVRWLERGERLTELAILRLIGLFDRPAAPEAIQALLTDTRMAPFTGQLEQVGSSEWDGSVDALREMGLLSRGLPDFPGTLDAHPLIREHFRDQLQKDLREFWLQGNHTLFDYYQAQAPPQPSNATEMHALYAAVTHGCAAGLHQQVFDEILLPRVWRDRRTNFSTRRLGMIGSDLVALSNYLYPRQWTDLRTPSLAPRARALVLTNAGVRLRQLGRLVEARECFRAVTREIGAQGNHAEDLEDASYAAAQYCELLVLAGKLTNAADESDSALFNAQMAIEYSAGSKDPYFSMHARSSLAEVYFMLNDFGMAGSLFEQAQSIDRERRPKPPFLYSQSLFRYGYFLIETDRAGQILDDAARNPFWGKNGDDSSLLSEAIRLLILGAARRALIENGNRESGFMAEAERFLNESSLAFRSAGYADYRVRGLIELAHFHRVRSKTDDYANALANLDEAAFEAKRGQMGLFNADILLQRAGCYLNFWPIMTVAERSAVRAEIEDTLAESANLVTTFGYARRQKMLEGLQQSARAAGILR